MADSLAGAKRTDPRIPVGHPDFVWTRGADVQATWRRFGWTPPSAGKPPVEEPVRQPAFVVVRRFG